MDTGNNRAGNFLKILKVEQRLVKNIIVLGESQEQGWKDFTKCLHNIFFRKLGSVGRSKQIPLQIGGFSKGLRSLKGEERRTENHGNRSWRDVVMQKQSAGENT